MSTKNGTGQVTPQSVLLVVKSNLNQYIQVSMVTLDLSPGKQHK